MTPKAAEVVAFGYFSWGVSIWHFAIVNGVFRNHPTEVKNSLDMKKLEGQWYEQTLGRPTPIGVVKTKAKWMVFELWVDGWWD